MDAAARICLAVETEFEATRVDIKPWVEEIPEPGALLFLFQPELPTDLRDNLLDWLAQEHWISPWLLKEARVAGGVEVEIDQSMLVSLFLRWKPEVLLGHADRAVRVRALEAMAALGSVPLEQDFCSKSLPEH